MARPRLLTRANWELFTAVLVETRALMRRVQLPTVAASLAYTTILSIIPVLAVSFAVFHAFGGMDKLLDKVEPYIISNLAHGSGSEVSAALHRFIDNTHATAVGAGGLVGLIITTMIMLSSAEKAINQVWGAHRERTLFSRFSAYWLFVTLGPMALAVAVGAATSEDLMLTQLMPHGAGLSLLAVGILFLIYRFVPNCPVNWRYPFIAAGITSLFWTLAREGYIVYIKKAADYNKIYGSLGAVPILLVWIYIMWLILLSGAAFAAALQKTLEKQQ